LSVALFEIASALASGGRERLDDWTSGEFTGSAAPYDIRQDTLHSPQVGDFRANLRKVTGCELAHLGACALALIP
jgi:hypothetical protein